VRFVDEDLNRAFGSTNNHSYEKKRADEIKKEFHQKQIDIIYDIHSTPTNSPAMSICTDNPESIALAKLFPIEHIVL
jgi:succinylglutamate desuccinylase